MSNDADMAPALAIAKRSRPHRRIVLAVPGIANGELRPLVDDVRIIHPADVRASQLPDEVKARGKPLLRRPPGWEVPSE